MFKYKSRFIVMHDYLHCHNINISIYSFIFHLMEFRILSLIFLFTSCPTTLSTERTTSFSTAKPTESPSIDLFCNPGDLTCPDGFCCTGFLCFPEHLKQVGCLPNSDGNGHDICRHWQMGPV